MTISYVGLGTAGTNQSSLNIGYPASGIRKGDLLIVIVSYKYGGTATVGTPSGSGWVAPSNNQAQGGSGTGGDNGIGAVIMFYKIADGTETGNTTLTLTSCNVARGHMMHLRSDKVIPNWQIACVGGSDGTAGTAWSAAAGSDPGAKSGDWMVVGTGSNTDAYTASAHSLSQSGMTWGSHTSRLASGTTTGDDVYMMGTTHVASAGTSSGNPTFTCTWSGSTANAPRGGSVMMRVRDGVTGDVAVAYEEVAAILLGDGGKARVTYEEVAALVMGDGGKARIPYEEIAVITTGDTPTPHSNPKVKPIPIN